ncbi:MAG: peptidylprolyl isomerase [Myxococcota bacterium]
MRLTSFLLIFSLGCEPADAETSVPGEIAVSGETLVTVNGNPITQGMIDSMVEQMPERVRKQMEATGQMSQMQDQLVLAELLYREALKRNIHSKPEVQTNLALAARSALAQALLEEVVKERTTDEAVKKHYDDRLAQYGRAQVKASHILVKDEAVIKEVKAKLDAGGDFAALAKEFSVDPGSKGDGGSLGWFSKKDMVGPFAEAAFNAEKGTVTDPVETRFGFHIIKIEDKRDKIPLADVREEIEGQLAQGLVQTYLDELKASATIVDKKAGAEPKK